MKQRLFKRPIEEQRADIRQRLDAYRLSRRPVCHIAMPDEDYQTMLEESRKAYEITHGLKLVPFSELEAHKQAGCAVEAVA